MDKGHIQTIFLKVSGQVRLKWGRGGGGVLCSFTIQILLCPEWNLLFRPWPLYLFPVLNHKTTRYRQIWCSGLTCSTVVATSHFILCQAFISIYCNIIILHNIVYHIQSVTEPLAFEVPIEAFYHRISTYIPWRGAYTCTLNHSVYPGHHSFLPVPSIKIDNPTLPQEVNYSSRGGEWYPENRGSRKILAWSQNLGNVSTSFFFSCLVQKLLETWAQIFKQGSQCLGESRILPFATPSSDRDFAEKSVTRNSFPKYMNMNKETLDISNYFPRSPENTAYKQGCT